MEFAGVTADDLNKASPHFRYFAAKLRKLAVPDVEKAVIRIHGIGLLQKGVSLFQDLIILTEIVIIDLAELAKLHIHETPAVKRRILHKAHFLGRKQHCKQNSEQVAVFADWYGVHCETFFSAAVDMNIDTLPAAVTFQSRAHMGVSRAETY